MTYKGAFLVGPAVLRWRIENRDRRDLASAAFDQGRPITLPAPSCATSSAILSVTPEDLPVQVNDATVLISPTVVRAGADWPIDLLVSNLDPGADQPGAGLQNLVGVRHQTAASVLARRRRTAALLFGIGILMLAAGIWSLGTSVGGFFVLLPIGSAAVGAALGLYGLGPERRAPVPDSWPGEPRRPRRVGVTM